MRKCISGPILIALLLLQTHALAQTAAVVHGPTRYLRTTGAPNIHRAVFSAADPAALYKLVVENGASGKDRLSSAVLLLNGQEIVKQNELNQTIPAIEKPVTLTAENALEVRLAGGPSGSITVSIICVSGCAPGTGPGSDPGSDPGSNPGFSVKISSPASGGLVNRSQVVIKGTINGSTGETGVTIQSTNAGSILTAPAEIQNSTFAGIAPLTTGENTITVTVTDASGKTATDAVQIYTQSIEEMVKLNIFPETGTAPLNVTLNAESSLPAAATYTWDTNGDGTVDQSGTELTSLTATYDAPGLYFPSVTVADGTGKTYTDTTVINVIDKTQLDILIKAKWEGMKKALIAGDVGKATEYFAGPAKEQYSRIFASLGSDGINSRFSTITELVFRSMRGPIAQYWAIRVEPGGEYAYPITFVQDENGSWKIMGF